MADFSPLASFNRRGMASTHWTTIRACKGNDKNSQTARERLCRDYWYPLYAHIKRQGHPYHDAEDLTQSFFAHILGNSWFERIDRSKGKFRSFLFASLDNFLRDHADGKKALKRGGAFQNIPLDLADAMERYSRSQIDSICPAEAYEVEWACALVEAARRRLEAEYFDVGKRGVFEALRVFLAINGDASRYETIAQTLGTSAENIKVSIHRLRKRYGAILREEVARTVNSPDDIVGEMLHLRQALAVRTPAAA